MLEDLELAPALLSAFIASSGVTPCEMHQLFGISDERASAAFYTRRIVTGRTRWRRC